MAQQIISATSKRSSKMASRGYAGRADWRYRQRRASIAAAVSSGEGVANVMKRFECTRGEARYWGQRALDPTWHIGELGGQRNTVFEPEVEAVVHALLWAEVKANPVRNVLQFAQVLRHNGWDVNAQWVRRTFNRWRFTTKKPTFRSINKYQPQNIIYYRYSLLVCNTLCRTLDFSIAAFAVAAATTSSMLLACRGRVSSSSTRLTSTREVSLPSACHRFSPKVTVDCLS